MLKPLICNKLPLTIVALLLATLYVISKYEYKMPKDFSNNFNKAKDFSGIYFNVSNKINKNISIIVVVNNHESITNEYSISIPTVQCYAQAMDYNLFIIDFSNKSTFPSKCNLKCVSF